MTELKEACCPETDKTFEESLARLEQIVSELEMGNLDLQKSLESYEEGVTLLTSCRRILDGARQKIYVLQGCDTAGQPVLTQQDPDDFQSDGTVAGRRTKTTRRKKTEEEEVVAPDSATLFENDF